MEGEHVGVVGIVGSFAGSLGEEVHNGEQIICVLKGWKKEVNDCFFVVKNQLIMALRFLVDAPKL